MLESQQNALEDFDIFSPIGPITGKVDFNAARGAASSNPETAMIKFTRHAMIAAALAVALTLPPEATAHDQDTAEIDLPANPKVAVDQDQPVARQLRRGARAADALHRAVVPSPHA